MAAAAAERGWQVAVLNMRGCGSSPVTSPRLFSAYRGANDDCAPRWRTCARRGSAPAAVAALGWSNSGTIVNNVMAEQATTHAGDPSHAIDAAVACATPLNMPANSANLQRPFHSAVYDVNLGKSLRTLWDAARPQYVDAATDLCVPVPQWDDASESFVADDELALAARSIREIDEAVTRRQFGYASVDDYYAAASSDQRLGQIAAPLLLLNAFTTRSSPAGACAARSTPRAPTRRVVVALTSHGGHLGWCDRGDPWGGPRWTERVCCGFLEAALEIEPSETCETVGCEVFD